MDNITVFLENLLGSLGENASSVIVTLLILIVGLIIAGALKGIATTIVKKTKIDEKVNEPGAEPAIANLVGTLVHSVVVLFVLLFVLERMGITSVLDPLNQMLNDFLAVIPKLIGAGIVGYAGWILANIVSKLVSLAAGKLDDFIASRGIELPIQLSKFIGAFVFGTILVPLAIVALGILDIPTITEPSLAIINNFATTVPNIIGAGIILVVFYFAAKFITFLLSGLLDGMNVDSLPARLGIKTVFQEGGFIKFICNTVMFFTMLMAITQAVEILGIEIISTVFNKALDFSWGILFGGIILIIGNFLANLAASKLEATSKLTASIAKFTILGLVFAMGLGQMGFAENIVTSAFTFTLGAAAVAVALAFGLGGREAAGKLCEKWFLTKK